MVSPKVLSSQRSPRPPLHGHDGSTKSNLKDLVVANVSSSQDGKAKSATVEYKPKSSRATTTPSLALRKAKSYTEQQVGGKHKQQEAQPTKPSKSAPVGTLWIKANPKFQFGQSILSATDVDKAGPGCVALYAYYMKACVENRTDGIVGMFKRHHFGM